MQTDLFQPHTISYVLAWVFSIPIFFGILGFLTPMLFEKTEDVPRLFTIWLLICIILFSPIRYIFFQIIVASVYPFQSLSAFLSLLYLSFLIPIVFSIIYAIGFGLPLLASVYVACGFKDNSSKARLFFGFLAAPFLFLLGNFLFFSILQYAAYSTHMLKAKDLIRATSGPAQYFYKYVVEFGTPLSFPKMAYDIGLKNLTNKERLRLHVASVYLGDDELYYYITSEFQKYTEVRNKYERLKKTGEIPEKFPELTEEEALDIKYISEKMMSVPLEDEDLKRISDINNNYKERTGLPFTEDQIELYLSFINTNNQYKIEFGNCLLRSFDTKKPFISDKLNKFSNEMRHLSLIRKSSIDANFRLIMSTAAGDVWTDENGKKYHPLTRERILNKIKQNEMIGENINQFTNALKGAE